MTERPQLPSEDELPEELPFVDLLHEPSASNGNNSRGMAGILIAAVLGSITAIGLFFVAKPYLVATDPPTSPKEKFDANDVLPAKVVQNEQPQQLPVQTTRVPSITAENQTPPPDPQTPVVTTTEPGSTDEPFPGLNAKLKQVIPLQSGEPSETVTVSPPDPTPVIRQPKPGPDAIVQTSRDIDAAFLTQIRSAKTREEKMLLVNVLNKVSRAEPEGSASRYVLLERAIELAVGAPDSDLTNELVSVITEEYDVAAYDYHLRAVDIWDRMKMPDMDPASERELHRLLARKAATLGDLAYERKDFKTAAGMYALASKRRDRADDKEIADLFGKKRTAARTKETRHRLATSLLRDLEGTPNDDAKNLEAGITCLQTGLWDEGLNCLSIVSDESLQNFAREQLNLRANPETLLQAGDHSWDAARTLDRNHALWLKELAISDYEAVFSKLTPLQMQKVKLRVAETGPVNCVLPIEIQHFALESNDFATISNVQVVRNHMGFFGNGRLYGAPHLELGIRGSALELDGSRSMVVCPQTENLIPGDSPLTISLWINTDRSQDAVIAGRMYRHASNVEPDFHLSLLASGHFQATLSPVAGDRIALQSNDQIPHNQWVHIAMTWDLHSLRLYLDGRETASLSVTGPHSQRILANRAWLAFGGENPSNDSEPRFAGRVDELRVYDQSLSPLQIFHVYLQDQTAED